MEFKETKNVVTKDNKLIEASYRLTMTEQQIVLLGIVKARESGLTPYQLSVTPFKVDVQEFAKVYNIADTSNLYRNLKQAIQTLYNRSVKIYELIDDIIPVQGETRWITKHIYADQQGYLSMQFTPDAIKYFTRLEKEFTSYDLKQIGNFTSVYAVRLYELLKQYQTAKYRVIQIETLRKILQLEDKYAIYADFLKNVINPSIEQINKYSEFEVTFKPVRDLRKIVALDFRFKIKGETKTQGQYYRPSIAILCQGTKMAYKGETGVKPIIQCLLRRPPTPY